MANQQPCRVCGSAGDVLRLSDGSGIWLDCPICGPYEITSDTLDELRHLPENDPLLKGLSAHLRQAADRGEELRVTTANWRGFAEAHMRSSVPTKMRRVLELIAAGAKPGAWTQPEPRLLTLRADVLDDEEYGFILAAIVERGLLEEEPTYGVGAVGGPSARPARRFKLTVKGWEAADTGAGAGVPGTCFVAMSFAAEMRPAFDDGIRPAVEADCGLEVLRVDRVEHNEKIDDFIIAGIRRAQFLVADVTLQRPGVYFEAGFAAALGRTVIWCVRHDDVKNIHFDTRQFNHIVWKEPSDLRAKLAARIRATYPCLRGCSWLLPRRGWRNERSRNCYSSSVKMIERRSAGNSGAFESWQSGHGLPGPGQSSCGQGVDKCCSQSHRASPHSGQGISGGL
jgi:hypothetical protein